MAKNPKPSGSVRFLEVAGTLATLFWLFDMAKSGTSTNTIARLDDDAAPVPRPNDYAVMYGEPGAPDYSGMAGLGDVEVGLEVTDDERAPLKLRRMEVVRADAPHNTEALQVVTQNTRQRAKRANAAIPEIVRNVVNRFGRDIKAAAALHNVPAGVIATKMCIENPDLLTRVVTGGGATGLMQIAPGTADSALRAEYKAGNLMPAEVAFFRAALGNARWAGLLAGRRAHTTADLQKPAYCIHIGTLTFGQYLRKYTTASGEVQLYKAAANYNRGDRAEYANNRVNSPDALIAFKGPGSYSTPSVTQQYIMLYCGPNGPLDYITRNGLLA